MLRPLLLNSLRLAILTPIAVVGAALPAGAIPIQVEFTAEVLWTMSWVGDVPADPGAVISGVFTYDSESPGSFVEPGMYEYSQAPPFNLELTAGTLSLSTDPGWVAIRDNWFGNDEFLYFATQSGSVAADWQSDLISVGVRLQDHSQTAFTGTDLPTQFSLDDFQRPTYSGGYSSLEFGISGIHCVTPDCTYVDPQWTVQSNFTSMSVTPIPEPGAAVAFSVGALVVGLAVRRFLRLAARGGLQ